MTYFRHFNFLLLFLNLKLICPGIRKNHETYVAEGVQRISIFLETAPGLQGFFVVNNTIDSDPQSIILINLEHDNKYPDPMAILSKLVS